MENRDQEKLRNSDSVATARVVEAKAVTAASAGVGRVVAKAVAVKPAAASPAATATPPKVVNPVPAAAVSSEAAISSSRPAAPELTTTATDQEQQVEQALRRRYFFTAAPSWLISLVVHVILLLILAAITLDPVKTVVSILNASSATEANELEQYELEAPQLDASELPTEMVPPPPSSVSEATELPEVESPLLTQVDASLDAVAMNAITESIMPSAVLSSQSLSQLSSSLSSRSAASRSEMLERFGGSAESEKAVALALKWIAEHQASDGGWTFAHNTICRGQCADPGDMAVARNGATAMALLPFLGAGQTHLEGQYKDTVKRGLAYLINRMQFTKASVPYGSWWEERGRMYSHGLAAITVCEAYAMTGDPDLLQPAQLSVNYLVFAQDPRGGGWRYKPQQAGDTSVVGWCVMALKSAKMGGLAVPDQTLVGANRFLDYVSSDKGAYYGYSGPTSNVGGRQATIAVGLLCRMYMGWPKEHVGLSKGVDYLDERGPKLNDLYYTYYATQVMRHHGGPQWERWNRRLRDNLIKLQEKAGHPAGSWHMRGSHSNAGGRLYSTSLATMILEVYYRHMPLYSERSQADDFEI